MRVFFARFKMDHGEKSTRIIESQEGWINEKVFCLLYGNLDVRRVYYRLLDQVIIYDVYLRACFNHSGQNLCRAGVNLCRNGHHRRSSNNCIGDIQAAINYHPVGGHHCRS